MFIKTQSFLKETVFLKQGGFYDMNTDQYFLKAVSRLLITARVQWPHLIVRSTPTSQGSIPEEVMVAGCTH